MDWDSDKLADLEHNSRVGGLDLKLGEANMVSSSSKRARGLGGSSVWCLVEGCGVDLSNERDYNRRHKVCVVHSKTAVVLVGGQEMRFCQQCSRFHLLEEFDEAKRSCRKRLDGHNRRRRKPQPECINSGGLFPKHQGTIFSSYPQILSSARAEPSWAGIDKAEEDAGYTHRQTMHSIDRQRYFPSAFHSYKEAKQFPFLQDSDSALERRMPLEYSRSSVSHLPQNSTTSESSNNRMFRNGLSQVLNSDCALSLLSSPIQSSGIELGQVMPSMSQSLVSSTQCSGFCQYSHSEYGGFGRYSNSEASNNVSRTGFSISDMEDDCGRLSKGFVSAEGSDAEDCSGFLHVAGEGSSDGPSRAFPFSWQ